MNSSRGSRGGYGFRHNTRPYDAHRSSIPSSRGNGYISLSSSVPRPAHASHHSGHEGSYTKALPPRGAPPPFSSSSFSRPAITNATVPPPPPPAAPVISKVMSVEALSNEGVSLCTSLEKLLHNIFEEEAREALLAKSQAEKCNGSNGDANVLSITNTKLSPAKSLSITALKSKIDLIISKLYKLLHHDLPVFAGGNVGSCLPVEGVLYRFLQMCSCPRVVRLTAAASHAHGLTDTDTSIVAPSASSYTAAQLSGLLQDLTNARCYHYVPVVASPTVCDSNTSNGSPTAEGQATIPYQCILPLPPPFPSPFEPWMSDKTEHCQIKEKSDDATVIDKIDEKDGILDIDRDKLMKLTKEISNSSAAVWAMSITSNQIKPPTDTSSPAYIPRLLGGLFEEKYANTVNGGHTTNTTTTISDKTSHSSIACGVFYYPVSTPLSVPRFDDPYKIKEEDDDNDASSYDGQRYNGKEKIPLVDTIYQDTVGNWFKETRQLMQFNSTNGIDPNELEAGLAAVCQEETDKTISSSEAYDKSVERARCLENRKAVAIASNCRDTDQLARICRVLLTTPIDPYHFSGKITGSKRKDREEVESMGKDDDDDGDEEGRRLSIAKTSRRRRSIIRALICPRRLDTPETIAVLPILSTLDHDLEVMTSLAKDGSKTDMSVTHDDDTGTESHTANAKMSLMERLAMTLPAPFPLQE
eukprot:Tbor_TRINITY_DN5467_c4_g1::TRINITY_DN5467_c4_g1_i1::g.24713::m.24713